jgi:hypothetical protein
VCSNFSSFNIANFRLLQKITNSNITSIRWQKQKQHVSLEPSKISVEVVIFVLQKLKTSAVTSKSAPTINTGYTSTGQQKLAARLSSYEATKK